MHAHNQGHVYGKETIFYFILINYIRILQRMEYLGPTYL